MAKHGSPYKDHHISKELIPTLEAWLLMRGWVTRYSESKYVYRLLELADVHAKKTDPMCQFIRLYRDGQVITKLTEPETRTLVEKWITHATNNIKSQDVK